MKLRVRRITALCMAALLFAGSGSLDPKVSYVHAEEAVEASAETTAETQPQTQAPTEAPPPETQAPTEAPPPETQAPTEAPPPETQAPTEAPPVTQAETAAETVQTEPQGSSEEDLLASEEQSELVDEKETEKDICSITADVKSATITVTLPKGKSVPETTVLDVDVTKPKNDKNSLRMAQGLLEKGPAVISGARFYELHLYNGTEEFKIPKGTRIEYTRADGLSLGQESCRQARFHVLDMSGSNASGMQADISLSTDDLSLTSASFTTAGSFHSFAIVGTQNRANDGEKITQKDLREKLKETARYVILADTYEGDAKEAVRTTAMDQKEEPTAAELLDKVSEYTLKLGNARAGDQLAVVNLYTDEDGNVLTDPKDPQDPLKAVVNADGAIDVTDRTVIINIIAVHTGDSTLQIPRTDVVVRKNGKEEKVYGKENTDLAGRVVYNVTTLETGTEGNWHLAPYTGRIIVKDRAVGNYYAPKAEITFEKNLIGGAYARKTVTQNKVIPATVTAELPKEKQTEAQTQEQTESQAETETQTETEAESESETEAETESEELVYEAAAEKGLPGGAKAGTVTVTKVKDDQSLLEGAQLALYNTKELTPEEGEPIPAGRQLYTWPSSATQEQDISGWILPDGEYVIREVKTPAGYAKAWDQKYTPQTDAQTKKVKPVSLTVVDKTVQPQTAADGFPEIAVRDSADKSFLPDIAISIEKTVTTIVVDSDGNVVEEKKEDKGQVASFTSETDYTAIDLASLYTEVQEPTVDKSGNITVTAVSLTIKETTHVSGYRYDSVSETVVTAVWDETTEAAKADYSQSEADRIATQDTNTGTWKLTFTQKEVEPFTIVSYKVDTTTVIPDTVFELYGCDGTTKLNPGTDYIVSDASVSGTSVKIQSKQAVITLVNENEIKALASDPLNHITVKWTTIPDRYYVVQASSKEGKLDFATTENVLELGDKTALGTVTITRKSRILTTGTANPADKAVTYYFTLLDSNGNSVTQDPKPLTVSAFNSKSTSKVVFENLQEGQYYLKETDQNGNNYTEEGLKQIQYQYSYLDESGAPITEKPKIQPGSGVPIRIKLIKDGSNNSVVTDNHILTYTNVYNEADTRSGSFKVKVRVVDENNQETPATLTAEYTVKWTAGGKNWKVNPTPHLSLAETSSATSKKYTIPFPASDKDVAVKVKLTSLKDGNGNSVAGKYTLVDDTQYTRLSSAQKTINITDGLTDGMVTFTLKKASTGQSVAQLSMTKQVTYQNVPMRVNATYYLGIFTDSACTKLLYKKPLSLSNASSRTSTLKINLYKLKSKSQSITLYFAETDSKGNVVSGGKKTGYNISLNQTSVTLSPSNAEASVILTNDIIKGSKAAQRLTDPSSGFAGDRSALAEAQHLANTNSVTGRKTGDDSPIGPLALAAMISGGVILLLAAVILLRRRRKRRG